MHIEKQILIFSFLVDLSSWRHKIESENEASGLDEVINESHEDTIEPPSPEKYKNGMLTIGCTG